MFPVIGFTQFYVFFFHTVRKESNCRFTLFRSDPCLFHRNFDFFRIRILDFKAFICIACNIRVIIGNGIFFYRIFYQTSVSSVFWKIFKLMFPVIGFTQLNILLFYAVCEQSYGYLTLLRSYPRLLHRNFDFFRIRIGYSVTVFLRTLRFTFVVLWNVFLDSVLYFSSISFVSSQIIKSVFPAVSFIQNHLFPCIDIICIQMHSYRIGCLTDPFLIYRYGNFYRFILYGFNNRFTVFYCNGNLFFIQFKALRRIDFLDLIVSCRKLLTDCFTIGISFYNVFLSIGNACDLKLRIFKLSLLVFRVHLYYFYLVSQFSYTRTA